MTLAFKRIGLFAKHNTTSVSETFQLLVDFLSSQDLKLVIDRESASVLSDVRGTILEKHEIASNSDLVIVVGGDGSLLNAARAVVTSDVPVLGINRGRLGFLADISPREIERELTTILQGQYRTEKRSLMQAKVLRNNNCVVALTALNDVVLHHSEIARMIEFEVYIDEKFVLSQRSDGLIAATPTGSTAYALSGGGPILSPGLNAFVLVPMFPHTLSSRPVVINDTSKVELLISHQNDNAPKVSCDGQEHFTLSLGDRIEITKFTSELNLLHPIKHNYFEVLRHKLGWNTNPTSDRYSPGK